MMLKIVLGVSVLLLITGAYKEWLSNKKFVKIASGIIECNKCKSRYIRLPQVNPVTTHDSDFMCWHILYHSELYFSDGCECCPEDVE